MREWAVGRTNPGIRISKPTKQSLHLLSDPPDPPACEQHGVALVEIENSDLSRSFDADLRESHELWACAECFPSEDDELDVSAVSREIASDWMHYREKFVQSNRPGTNHGPTFTFR